MLDISSPKVTLIPLFFLYNLHCSEGSLGHKIKCGMSLGRRQHPLPSAHHLFVITTIDVGHIWYTQDNGYLKHIRQYGMQPDQKQRYWHKLWLWDAALMSSKQLKYPYHTGDIEGPRSLKRDCQFLSYCGIKYTLYMSLTSSNNIWEILVSKDKF